MPTNSLRNKKQATSTKKQKQAPRRDNDTVTSYIDFPYVFDPVPVANRKGIKISEETRALLAQHDHSNDDPENPVLPADVWAKAIRHEELFRPIKKQTTVRIDADVLAWLKSKGEGHLSRINSILRAAMAADRKG